MIFCGSNVCQPTNSFKHWRAGILYVIVNGWWKFNDVQREVTLLRYLLNCCIVNWICVLYQTIVYLKLLFSALGVSHIMRCINLRYLLTYLLLVDDDIETLEMNATSEQEAALRVLKTVVPCSMQSKCKDETSFRYCIQMSAYLCLAKYVAMHINQICCL